MASFLITGGAGFIGSHISEKLVKEGHKVKILDNFSSGSMVNLQRFADEIEVIEGDIRNCELVKKSLIGIECVYHEAAIASVQASVEDPFTTEEINVAGTISVLEAARDANVKRVIFASSAAIYGDSEVLPKSEAMMPEPLSPYALHKLSGEHYMKIFHKLYGLETVCLRYFNVFGPRQNPASPYSGVISIFADRLIRGISPVIFGDGEQTRDFVYIDNVVQANLLAAFSDKVGNGEVINIATGTKTSLNKLVNTIRRILKSECEVKYEERRKGDILNSVADTSVAEKLLGYEPKVSLEEGLYRMLKI